MNPPEFSTDPLIYFLLHSSLFVLGLGTLFFTLGILLGRLIWSPYKRQTLQLLAEQEIHKGEIAKLKRHLAEAKLNGAPLTATDLRQNVGPIPSPLPNPKPTQATTSPPEFEVSLPKNIVESEVIPPLLDEPLPTKVATRPIIRSKTSPAALSKPPQKNPSSPSPSEEKPNPPAVVEHSRGSLPKAASPLSAIIHPQAPLKPEGTARPNTIGNGARHNEGDKASPSSEPEDDPVCGPIYHSRPHHADDLTQIKGVATVLQARLNEAGIYTFKQIAKWSSANVQHFSNRLAFKDRIVREKWVEQSQQLQAQKSKTAQESKS